MVALPPHHGRHVPSDVKPTTKINWMVARRYTARESEILWTCDCRRVRYVLVSAAGRRFIRRYERPSIAAEETVTESPRMLAGEADALWARVLAGEAA